MFRHTTTRNLRRGYFKMDETNTDDKIATFEQSESVKLIKNSKGYNWEIKILGSGPGKTWTTADALKLQEIDSRMRGSYGS